MRVLFWSETFWPRAGGVETLGLRLLSALRGRGWKFEVVTWAEVPDYQVEHHEGVPIHRFPFFGRRGERGAEATLEQVARVARVKRSLCPDLVHLHSYGRSAWFHVATAGRLRRPTILSLHQSLPEAAFVADTLAARVLRDADAITCCSQAVYEATTRRAPELTSRMGVIANALPTPALEGATPPREARGIVFVGRLVPEKGLAWVLPGLRGILQSLPGARLVVVGEGPLRGELEQRVTALGLRASVEFVGHVPSERVPSLLQQAAVVVIPSLSEGFGLVALEAALVGRPVVASRVGGLPEVVLHAETGLLVRPGDVEGFAAAVRFLLEHPAEAERIGRAARERALEAFGWEPYVDAFDGLYRRLASPAPVAREQLSLIG